MNRKRKCLSILAVVLLLIVLGVTAGKSQLTGQTVTAAEISKLQEYLQEHEPVKKVRIAILDTGLDESRVTADVLDTGINLSASGEGNSTADDNGHGTKIAELVTEYESDCMELLPIKVAAASGNAEMDSLCQGVEEAVEQGADIIVMSMNLVPSGSAELLESQIEAAAAKGTAVIVPAGNEGLDVKNAVPAGMDAAMVVAAASVEGMHVDYSNYGDTIDYSAYGGCDGEYGTSFSAARVAGMLAGVYARGGDITVFDELLQDLGASGQDNYYGKGFVSLTQAAEAASGYELSYASEEQEAYELDYNSIMQLEWKNMDTRELENYFSSTEAVYIGYFLENLNEEELQQLKEKTELWNHPVKVSVLENTEEETDTFQVQETQEYTFFDYCIREYEAVKDQAKISEWRLKNGTGCVFYISSADRSHVWKYEVKGFNNCYFTDYVLLSSENYLSTQVADGKITVTETCIKGKDGEKINIRDGVSYVYHHPEVDTVSAFVNTVRSHEVGFKSNDGTVNTTSYNPQFIAAGNDDGTISYAFSISFKNFEQEPEGYHMGTSTIQIYKYNTNNTAMTYLREVVTTRGSTDGNAYVKFLTKQEAKENEDDPKWTTSSTYYKQALKAKKVIKGTLTAKYGGSFKNGVTYDSSKEAEYYKGKMNTGHTKTVKNVYRSHGDNTIKTGQKTFSLQFTSANLGVDVYSGGTENVVMSSDQAEYVIGVTENTYTVEYKGNGSTSGSVSKQTPNYFDTFKLRSNGFQRTGYTFKEWNTKANGKGTSYQPGQSVTKLVAKNDETLTLYAIWKVSTASYTVKHYKQNAADDKYTLAETETATGTVGASVTPDTKTYTGFTSPAKKSATVKADNSAAVEYYYTRNTSTLKVDPNGGTWDGQTTVQSFTQKYETTKAVPLPTYKNAGYTFKEWQKSSTFYGSINTLTAAATYTYGATKDATSTLTAIWKPNTYFVQFDGNGATEGTVGTIVATVDEPFTLPENQYKRVLEQGESKFLGWARTPESRQQEFGDQQKIKENLTLNQGETVTLYAIWDDCPWIEASDRYFNLWWAQNGKITEEELLSTVSATDREDVTLEARTTEQIAEAGEAASVSLSDYDSSTFTTMTEPGEVTVTYKAVDSVGNVVYKEVLIHIYDASPLQPTESMYLRFINKKYYEKSYEEGGLHPDSIWRTDAAYKSTLENALNNLENNTPKRVYSFTAEEVAEAKEYVEEHGFSDTKEANALQGFFDRFMR